MNAGQLHIYHITGFPTNVVSFDNRCLLEIQGLFMHTYNPTLLRSMHIPQHELLAAATNNFLDN
jgi:hypothetical protein